VAGIDRMTTEEIVRKVMLDEGADAARLPRATLRDLSQAPCLLRLIAHLPRHLRGRASEGQRAGREAKVEPFGSGQRHHTAGPERGRWAIS
jgi:hypothetical protein